MARQQQGSQFLCTSQWLTISTPARAAGPNGAGVGTGSSSIASAGRDLVKALQIANKKVAVLYGSQTGTAEDYATRIAKEVKAKFGLSSLVVDPEECVPPLALTYQPARPQAYLLSPPSSYDFDTLDELPSDCVLVFVVATYGEGEAASPHATCFPAASFTC